MTNRIYSEDDYDELMQTVKKSGADFINKLAKSKPDATEKEQFDVLLAVFSAFQLNAALGCVLINIEKDVFLKEAAHAYDWAIKHHYEHADELAELHAYYKKHGKFYES